MTASAGPWPILPLKNAVLFPRLFMPLSIGRSASLAAVEAALARDDKTLLVVAQRNPEADAPEAAELHAVGTLAVIRKMERMENGVAVMVQGTTRVRLRDVAKTEGYSTASADPIADPIDAGASVEALQREVFAQIERVQMLAPSESPVGLVQVIAQAPDGLYQLFVLAAVLGLDVAKCQALLETEMFVGALERMHGYLSHELEVLELRAKISSQVQTQLSREQREYVLRQQLRTIQEELGEQRPEAAEIADLRRRLKEAELPDDVRKEAEREASRLDNMPSAAADYQVIRTYLELVLELPWKHSTPDNLDLARAQQTLDRDHFGLPEVKRRILEHLAVLKMNPAAKAPILCFVGPPGVGKTSLGQSIARALERKFERFSLGGLHDEAELRGHRRTYIGAMPGRIIQAIRRAGANNPLLMLDEVDKLGQDFRGDPASALLEVLDPAQNATFRDNYLDLPFDLSRVFFITTANTLDSIPAPLLDRMEVLRLPGYTDAEKIAIARRYLIPRQLAEAGLSEAHVQWSDATLSRIISRYTREAGLRQLERSIARICRQAALRFAQGETALLAPAPADLLALLGPEKFFLEEVRKTLPPGVAAGLAWTEAGGEVLYIESLLLPGGSGLAITGQLGEVMQESARAAQSFVRSRGDDLAIPIERLEKSGVHLHVPAGAVPKDGPSAGVAMTAALASLYTRKPARADTAMTGEITLTGLVLPVGGIKEKVLAAHRAGLKRVVLPKANASDLEELTPDVRSAIEFVLVERIAEALQAVIPEL